MPSHTGIIGNELADAAAKLAAEDTLSDGFPFPSALSQARYATIRLFQMKLVASSFLGHPNWHAQNWGFAHSVRRRLRQPSTLYPAAPLVDMVGDTYNRGIMDTCRVLYHPFIAR